MGEIVDGLATTGFAVIDGFLGPETSARLAAAAMARAAAGRFRAARVGRRESGVVIPEIRGDRVSWLDEDEVQEPALAAFLDVLDVLRGDLNAALFAGLVRVECHATHYPVGAFYRPHVDAFAGGRPERMVSFVYFLNEGWRDDDGGHLVLHVDPPRALAPERDRLVVFRARDLLHEVAPTARERFSLTGWFSTRAALPFAVHEPKR